VGLTVLLGLLYFFLWSSTSGSRCQGNFSAFSSWNTLGHLEGQVDTEVMVFFVRIVFWSKVVIAKLLLLNKIHLSSYFRNLGTFPLLKHLRWNWYLTSWY